MTVDDLEAKSFLGRTRDERFDGLRRALTTALTLHDRAGLEFVVAPAPDVHGALLGRLGTRYTVSVYGHVCGVPGRFGEVFPSPQQEELVAMLVRLHSVPRDTVPEIGTAALDPPLRRELEAALRELEEPWAAGPYSEQARTLFAEHAPSISGAMARFDRLAARDRESQRVVTHGEIHGGNLVQTRDGLRLVDWDTVALATPERDLWMVDAGDGEALRMYEHGTGRSVDADALELYRLRWRLDDTASFVQRLRSQHERSADTEHWWAALFESVELLGS